MNILTELKARFRSVLDALVDDPTDLLAMIRPAQDAKFGDYQANCAMPLGKRLGKAPRDIATGLTLQSNVDGAGEGGVNPRGGAGLVANLPVSIPRFCRMLT